MTKRRALLIHTEKSVIRTLSLILEKNGYHVAVAIDADQEMKLAQQELFQIILLGIQSPDLKGLEILQRLKKRGTTNDLPVLLLLEKFDEGYVAQGLEMGAEDYLVRPYDDEEVLRRVGVLCMIRQHEMWRRDLIVRYRELFDGEKHGLFLSSREGRFLDVNESLAKLLGYKNRDELLNIDITKDLYWNPSDRRNFQKIIEGQGVVRDFKVHFKTKDGDRVTVLLNGQVVRDEKGAIIGYQGSSEDISAQMDSTRRVTQKPEQKPFMGRFFQQFFPRLFPIRREFFSVMKMTELVAERYEKIERLGLGSDGEIWKVRDIEKVGDALYYVAKIAQSRKLNYQFRKEADICRKLESHPNAIKIIDVTEHRGRVVVIQDYVEGRTLKELLECSLDEHEKENIVLQLVDIVAHAHRHKIIHRDIKPENIFVGRDGTVKLLDYGVAKELKERDISCTMVGSRPFMAPEQIMGESQIASDVWALGVILYAIYTEYLPFYHDNEKVLMDTILTYEPEPPRKMEPRIPVVLEKIILKCLKKNPGERFPDAGALKDTLLEKFPSFGKNAFQITRGWSGTMDNRE